MAGIAFTGCDDFLDDNRNPLTSEVNTPAFWNNETNVQNEANLFYNSIIGYGNYCSRVSSTTTYRPRRILLQDPFRRPGRPYMGPAKLG